MSGTLGVIYTIITVCIVILLILIGIVFFMLFQRRNNSKSKSIVKGTEKKSSTTKLQGIESMSKFLDFDRIVDSMIVRKKGEQYVMVIQCKGVNYDLLGEEEKVAVEHGFVQFLNVIRFPIQLYVQTRSLNLKNNIEQYENKVNEVREEITKIDAHIRKETANGRMDLVRKLQFERRRKLNILEYGLDVTNYVSRLSQNRNVLQQNTYVILSYYKSEFGGEISNYSREEVENIAFSELYTRAQTLIRGLSAAGVTGRVINSEELAELLYIAYNRDDSELINIRKSVDAQYDSLYNTAKDVLEKQKEVIEKKIDAEAIDLTARSIKRADKIRKLRKENQAEIKRRALNYVEMYKNEMTDELYDETKRQVEKADLTGEKAKEKAKAKVSSEQKSQVSNQNKEKIVSAELRKKRIEAKKRRLQEETKAKLEETGV